MAIPVDIKPIEPKAATPTGGSRGDSVYGLYRDGESQLWVLAQLRKRGGKFMVGFKHAKQIFNFPLDNETKANTWLANANNNLKSRGPKWLKLGIKDSKTDHPKIVFKSGLEELTDLPTLADLIDVHGIEVDRANELLETWRLPHIGDDEIPSGIGGDDDEADDEDDEDEVEEEPEEEKEEPKKKPTRSRSRKKKD